MVPVPLERDSAGKREDVFHRPAQTTSDKRKRLTSWPKSSPQQGRTYDVPGLSEGPKTINEAFANDQGMGEASARMLDKCVFTHYLQIKINKS